MSQCMHAFVREHIVRGAFKNKVRPVLLNRRRQPILTSMREICLLWRRRQRKRRGAFVMDDSWFGERNDDAFLGDWEVNEKKLREVSRDSEERSRRSDWILVSGWSRRW